MVLMARGPGQKRESLDFGVISSFWSRYERLADKQDEDILRRLHSNLDVLLIFVSVSIATAFQEDI